MSTPDNIPNTDIAPPPIEDIPTREPDDREMPDETGDDEVPSDVEPGSDADIDRGGEATEPSPDEPVRQ